MKPKLAIKPLVYCEIAVTTRDGVVHPYKQYFKTTIDAVIDAVSRFGVGCKISVRRAA